MQTDYRRANDSNLLCFVVTTKVHARGGIVVGFLQITRQNNATEINSDRTAITTLKEVNNNDYMIIKLNIIVINCYLLINI